MANIDDILKNEITDKEIIEHLQTKGIDIPTNKNALIQTLVDAGISGDTKAAIYLLENSSKEKTINEPQTPLSEARKMIDNAKQKT